MNAFKSNNFNTILIIILIVLNLVSLYFLVINQKPSPRNRFSKHNGRHPDRSINFFIKKLELDENQAEEFGQLKKQHLEQMREARESIHKLRTRLFDNLGNENFDLEMVTDSISLNQKMMDQYTYHHFGALRAICSETQKKKFDKLIHKVAGAMGPPIRGKSRRKRNF